MTRHIRSSDLFQISGVNGLYISSYYGGGMLGSFLPGFVYQGGSWGSFILLLALFCLLAWWISLRLGES